MSMAVGLTLEQLRAQGCQCYFSLEEQMKIVEDSSSEIRHQIS